MSFTRVVGPGIHTQSNINSHNIKIATGESAQIDQAFSLGIATTL